MAGPGSRVTAVAATHHRLRGARSVEQPRCASLDVHCAPTYIRGYAEQSETGAVVGLGGWLGRLARYRPGFNAHREAGPPPPPPPSSSLLAFFVSQPLQPYRRLCVLVYPSLSDFPSGVFRRLLPSAPLVPRRIRILLFVLAPVAPLLVGTRQSTNLAERGEIRRKGERDCGKAASEKRGQLADGHGAEEIWIGYT